MKIVRSVKLVSFICIIILIVSLVVTACAKPAPAPSPAPKPTPAPAPAPAPKPEPIVWKLNSWFPPQHVSAPGLNWAVDEIAKRSNGLLTIEVYPAFSLGFAPPNWLRDHKEGLIDISIVFDMVVCGEEPSFCVIEADNLWQSEEQLVTAIKSLASFKKDVYKNAYNSEMIAAGMIPGFTAVIGTTKKQAKTVADLKGMKIRAPNVRMKELLEASGAAPQTIPRADVYMSLKTGVIDGFASGYGSLYDEKFHEVTKYVAKTGMAAATAEDIVVSPRVWDPLPDDLKQIVTDVFTQWGEDTMDLAVGTKLDNEDKEKLQGAGVECIDWSPADRASFNATELELHKVWRESEGGRVMEAWKIVEAATGIK